MNTRWFSLIGVVLGVLVIGGCGVLPDGDDWEDILDEIEDIADERHDDCGCGYEYCCYGYYEDDYWWWYDYWYSDVYVYDYGYYGWDVVDYYYWEDYFYGDYYYYYKRVVPEEGSPEAIVKAAVKLAKTQADLDAIRVQYAAEIEALTAAAE